MTLLRRQHVQGGTQSTAIYSPCERYRYALVREWGSEPRLAYIMLNPSKATELANDPTIERCQRRAMDLGYGAFAVVNLFAWRETSPAALRRAKKPVGTSNDEQLGLIADWADDILAGWGVHGAHLNRGPAVRAALQQSGTPLHHLGLTKGGHPRHPLYVSYRQQMMPWLPD